MSIIREYLDSVTKVIARLSEESIRDVVETLKTALSEGKQVFLLGNGGSAATASHIASDFQKGVKECTKKRFRVVALTDNVAIMTAWANDTHYENIFAEQLDSLLQPGDVVLAISGSGNSANIIRAVEKANELGATTIGWCGFEGGKLSHVAQKSIIVDSSNMQQIEDVHLLLGHLIFSCMKEECCQSI